MTHTKTFIIKYIDPETEEQTVEFMSFEDTEDYPAELWAEDYAYVMADKGWYTIEELKNERRREHINRKER